MRNARNNSNNEHVSVYTSIAPKEYDIRWSRRNEKNIRHNTQRVIENDLNVSINMFDLDFNVTLSIYEAPPHGDKIINGISTILTFPSTHALNVFKLKHPEVVSKYFY